MNGRFLPVAIHVIAHLNYQPNHLYGRRWLVVNAGYGYRTISEIARARINLVDC